MARMGADGRSSAGDDQIVFRVDGDLKESYRDLLNDEGSNFTDDLTAFVEGRISCHVETDGGRSMLPEDDELRRAFRLLDDLASPTTRRVSVEVAETELADKLNRPKESVRRYYLWPLETHEPPLISPKSGVLTVREVEA